VTLASAPDPIRLSGLQAAPAPEAEPLARLGTLEVGLAANRAEREASFALRHAVFVAGHGEMAGDARGLETDAHDRGAVHLLVRDTAARDGSGAPATVGTCRLVLPQPQAEDAFAAASLFALAPLLAAHRDLVFCEVGRACVAPSHRRHGVIEALWRGLWVFSRRRHVDVLFGAASFPGADPRAHAETIAALTATPPPPSWRVAPRPEVAADLPAPGAAFDREAVLRALPPLIRGYLHLGALFSTGAAIDRDFGTTDLLVMTRLAATPARHRAHFARVTGV